MADNVEARLETISEITRSARGVWLLQLGLASYAIVALAGVTDADFFVPERQTMLPIVNFPVPTKTFMMAGPLLLAIVHAYFHLYAARLWREVAELPRPGQGQRGWERVVSPWMVSDLAFGWRLGSAISANRRLAGGIALLLSWWFPPLVAIAFAIRSFAAHEFMMSAGLSLLAAVLGTTSLVSYFHGRYLIRGGSVARGRTLAAVAVPFVMCAGIFLPVSWVQTVGLSIAGWHAGPYTTQLNRAAFVPKPEGWRYWADARRSHLASYFGTSPAETEVMAPIRQQHPAAMESFRSSRRLAFDRPDKPSASGADFAGAEMRFLFAPYVDFLFASLDGANMQAATLEGAVFRGASMRGTDMDDAHLEAANFTASDLRGASLSKAWLTDAVFGFGRYIPGNREAERCADLTGTAIHGAYVDGADFSGAILEGAYLKDTDLRRAKGLTQAQLDWTIGDEKTALSEGFFVPSCYVALSQEAAASAAEWKRMSVAEFEETYACSPENPLKWFPPRPPQDWPDLQAGDGRFCPAAKHGG